MAAAPGGHVYFLDGFYHLVAFCIFVSCLDPFMSKSNKINEKPYKQRTAAGTKRTTKTWATLLKRGNRSPNQSRSCSQQCLLPKRRGGYFHQKLGQPPLPHLRGSRQDGHGASHLSLCYTSPGMETIAAAFLHTHCTIPSARIPSSGGSRTGTWSQGSISLL